MYSMFKKMIFASIIALVVLTTGAWQKDHVVLAEKQGPGTPETPLYSGLTWKNVGASARSITVNIKGDAISLSGETYQAVEKFTTGLPQDVLDYYSNEQLAQLGWSSYDAVDLPGGVRKVFYNEAGVYLSVESQICSKTISSTCFTVWKSEQSKVTSHTPSVGSSPEPLATGSFGKISPTNGANNVNPTSVVLSWGTFSPTPDKYSYCIKAGSECVANDPNWTGTYTNTSVTLTNLLNNTVYYWQVKAITCADCIPKIFTYANSGTWWTFTTKQSGVSIVGNVGVAGATLSYIDGSAKTVTSDGVGNYYITVPTNWSGTVTPTKTGYTFLPVNTTYTNLVATQTITNYIAIPNIYNISGNAGVGGATMSYVDGGSKTVIAGPGGDYSIPVPYNWSGTVVPSKLLYTFAPVSRTYSNVVADQVGQNYSAFTPGNDSTGVFHPATGTFSLRNSLSAGAADYVIAYGASGDYPVVGDWDGNGTDTIGYYRNGTFYLRNSNTSGLPDITFAFGAPGDQPIVGDWNGDGIDTIGVYRSSTITFYLRNSNSAGSANSTFSLGLAGDVGIAGDWNGDGVDTTGVFRPSNGALYLKNTNATGFADLVLTYGLPGDMPVTGDWNNDGVDTIGIYRVDTMYLRNSNTNGFADIVFVFGVAGDMPVSGNWNGIP